MVTTSAAPVQPPRGAAAAARSVTAMRCGARVLVCAAAMCAAATVDLHAQAAAPEPAPAPAPTRLGLSRWFSDSTKSDGTKSDGTKDESTRRTWVEGLVFDGGCVGCGGSRETPRNPNAPWTAHAGLTTRYGRSQLSVGVVGRRNHRLAQYLVQPIGEGIGAAPPVPAMAALTDMSRTGTDWQLTARVQRTLKRGVDGRTVGVVADVVVPLNGTASTLPAASGLAAPGMSSTAVRVGVQFGF